MYIHFTKAYFLVRFRYLTTYLTWSWQNARRTTNPLKVIATAIWSPCLVVRLPLQVRFAINECNKLGLDVSWVRYPTDGTRLQVFDSRNACICKVAKQPSVDAVLIDELQWRAMVGPLAPAIMAVTSDSLAFVEEWVDGRKGIFSMEELRKIINKLNKHLYQVEWINIEEYLHKVKGSHTNKIIQNMSYAMNLIGWVKVPASRVHGDLTCSNIIVLDNGESVLLDWEYARICAVSNDLWFYLFHGYLLRTKTNSIGESFYREVKEALTWIDLRVANVMALHLFHLLEREMLYLRNGLNETSSPVVFIRKQVDSVMNRLSSPV